MRIKTTATAQDALAIVLYALGAYQFGVAVVWAAEFLEFKLKWFSAGGPARHYAFHSVIHLALAALFILGARLFARWVFPEDAEPEASVDASDA